MKAGDIAALSWAITKADEWYGNVTGDAEAEQRHKRSIAKAKEALENAKAADQPMYAWLAEFESQAGRQFAWVMARTAKEATKLVGDQNSTVACFYSCTRHSLPRVLVYFKQ